MYDLFQAADSFRNSIHTYLYGAFHNTYS